jgi:ribose/xylose/arabinose/galactoside ABC-type transport system permease subunit
MSLHTRETRNGAGGPDPWPRRAAAFLLGHLPWLLAAVILAVTVALVPALHRPAYWLSLAEDFFAPAVLALALTPVLLTGGIDLSVGSVAVFAGVVAGVLLRDGGWPVAAALAAAVAAGLVAGLANGALVTLGVMPLVATLATRELFRGLAFTASAGTGVSGLPASLGGLWRGAPLGVPIPVLVFGVLAFVTYAVVHHTWVGRAVFAVGDNEEAARFAGVPVRRLKLGLYAASGLLAGLCGAAGVLRFRAAKADAHKTLELTAIACVVLGGVRVTGGSGHVGGTLLGTVTVAVLLTGLQGVWPEGREMALGALVIGIAVTNEAARRLAARRFPAGP